MIKMLKGKSWLLIFGMLLLCRVGASFFFFWKIKNQLFLAVIPHFTILPGKVSDFYTFLKEQYFAEEMPDQIILLSPNHFFTKQKKVEGTCTPQKIAFKNQTVYTIPFDDPRIECWGEVFYFKGGQKYTKDHGLGEHFRWINEFFPDIPLSILALPSHLMTHSDWIAKKIQTLPGKTFVIASVDFSHYLAEEIAQKHDELSFATLAESGNFEKIRALDVDCPACLGVMYRLAEKSKGQVQQWWRDSSSTIVGRDLKEENTSRQFLRRKSAF